MEHWDSSIFEGIRTVADNCSEHNLVSAVHSLAASLDPAAPVSLCYRGQALAGFTCYQQDRLVLGPDAQELSGNYILLAQGYKSLTKYKS